MDEIIKQAKLLGEMITESLEFKHYESAKTDLEKEELLNDAAAYENAVSVVENNLFKSDTKLLTDANELVLKYKDNTLIQEYIKSKRKLNLLLGSVNQTLAFVTGLDGATKTSCGGCTACPKRG